MFNVVFTEECTEAWTAANRRGARSMRKQEQRTTICNIFAEE